MARKKRKPKTLKEKKFVKAYLKTGNGTQAAMQSYDVKNRKIAGVIAAQNLAKLSIGDIMDRQGLTDDKLVGVIINGLEATKPVLKLKGKKSKPKEVQIPDHAVRHKYLETSLKLKDKFPSTKVESTVSLKDIVADADKYVK